MFVIFITIAECYCREAVSGCGKLALKELLP
jgi:hypothetical protein